MVNPADTWHSDGKANVESSRPGNFCRMTNTRLENVKMYLAEGGTAGPDVRKHHVESFLRVSAREKDHVISPHRPMPRIFGLQRTHLV